MVVAIIMLVMMITNHVFVIPGIDPAITVFIVS